MASSDIVLKINELVSLADVFSHERDAVYFLVQMRKLMERDDILDNYKAIKFYCDWVVHPQKDRNHGDIDDIYQGIYQDCVNFYSENIVEDTDNVLSLLQFSQLRADLEPLFDQYNLDARLLGKQWIKFTRRLLDVLVDQPLVNVRGEYINKMIIRRFEKSGYVIEIVFTQPIVDTRGYRHKNHTYGIGYSY